MAPTTRWIARHPARRARHGHGSGGRRADATRARPESSQPRPRPPRRTHGSFPGPPHPARRPRDRRPRRHRAGRTGLRPQPAHPHGGHAGRGLAPPPPRARPGSARRVAPRFGVGPRRVRRGTSRSVRDVPRYRGCGGVHGRLGCGVLRARRDAPIRDGRHGHGRVGARGAWLREPAVRCAPGDRPRRTVPGTLRPGSGPWDEGSSWRSRSC